MTLKELGQIKARRARNFFQGCLTHTKGKKWAGQPFDLLPFQDKVITDLFGTLKPDGTRQYRKAYLELPKKNGKSELAAGIALYMLFCDDEPGAEVYSAASTRNQAGVVFRVAAQMVRQSPMLSDLAVIVDSTKSIYLKDDPNSFYKALSADGGTEDGVNPSAVIFDELHRQKKRDLWDVLTFGSDTRDQPLLFAISTAGIQDESPLCWEIHEYARNVLDGVFDDPSFYALIHGLPLDEDWTVEGEPATGNKPASGWFAANPALGHFIDPETVREQAVEAKRSPTKQASFRRFRLNQWIEAETIFIPEHEWDACGEPFDIAELAGKTCFAGLDLSSTIDLTALVLAFPIDDLIYLLPFCWLPGDGLREHSIKQNVGYDHWAKEGFLETTEGNVIDYGFVRKKINELGQLYDIVEIASDPWNATQIRNELTEDGFLGVDHRQGFASMSAPTKEFERLVLGRKIRHGGHPILRWSMRCTTVKSDPAGNIKPAKPDRLKGSKRIDPIVAAIMAISGIIRHEKIPEIDPDELMFA